MATVQPDNPPAASTLWSLHRPGDFLDCHSVAAATTLREATVQGSPSPAGPSRSCASVTALFAPSA